MKIAMKTVSSSAALLFLLPGLLLASQALAEVAMDNDDSVVFDMFYASPHFSGKAIASLSVSGKVSANPLASFHITRGTTGGQVDPFYLRLLEEGKALFNQGKIGEAIKNLEIAAFGFVEDPLHLLEAYVYLVIGHYRLRNIERSAYFLSEIERLNLKSNLAAAHFVPSILNEFFLTESLLWRLGIAALTEVQRKVLGETKERGVEGETKRQEAKTNKVKSKEEAARSGQIAVVDEDSPAALERMKKEFSLLKLLAGKLPPVQATPVQEMIKLEESLRADPRNGVCSLRLALVCEELGQWKKAREALKNYLQLVPDCAAHRFELGRVLLVLRKPKEALEEIKRAATFFTGDIEYHQTKGKIHEQLNQLEEARLEFERARFLKIGDTNIF